MKIIELTESLPDSENEFKERVFETFKLLKEKKENKTKKTEEQGTWLGNFLQGGSKITELVYGIKNGEIPLNQKNDQEDIEWGEYIIKPPNKLGTGSRGEVIGISAEDKEGHSHNIAVKIPLMGKEIKEEEYKRMRIFGCIHPNNIPKVYEYYNNEMTQKLLMEPIEGFQLRDIPLEILLEKPELITRLGKIIAVMHNQDFIHGDLHSNNVILDEQGIWKIIDFGGRNPNSSNEKNIKLEKLIELEKNLDFRGKIHRQGRDVYKVMKKCPDKKIKNIFFQNYLINRNLITYIDGIYNQRPIDYEAGYGLFEFIKYIVENINLPSNEVNKYLSMFLLKIENLTQEKRLDKCEVQEAKELRKLKHHILRMKLKERLLKNPNIDLSLFENLKHKNGICENQMNQTKEEIIKLINQIVGENK